MKENCTLDVITIASNNATNLKIFSILQDDKIVYVWDAVLIRLLSQALGVPYKLIIPPGIEWGRKLADGNWTGLIGMVNRSEVDLAVGPILLAEDRFEAVSFSYPRLFSDFTFMTDKLKPFSKNEAFLKPFPLILWILIIITVLVVSFLLTVLIFKRKTLQNVLFQEFGNILGQSVQYKVQKIGLRLFVSTWLIFIFVITSSYKAIFLSFLSFPPLSGIRNIKDLAAAAEKNKVTCYTFKDHALPKVLLKSQYETWRSIGKCLDRNKDKHGYPEDFFAHALSKKAFLIGRINTMKYEKDYFISKDSFLHMMFALPVSKNFRCKTTLNRITHRLFASGLFLKHSKDEQFHYKLRDINMSFDTDESHNPKALRISDFEGAFIMLIFGYILASITFFIEIVVKHCFCKSNM